MLLYYALYINLGANDCCPKEIALPAEVVTLYNYGYIYSKISRYCLQLVHLCLGAVGSISQRVFDGQYFRM
jgi:hypothetical protein